MAKTPPVPEYEPHAQERRAQAFWEKGKVFHVEDGPGKFYCLSMFPYPSGKLHMGHVRNYTIADAISRWRRMRGDTVMQPMGWDAFGLPAENAALQNDIAPETWTRGNIKNMRAQLKALGFAYDWGRELATCDPGYYRWEQWLFLKLLARGVAYRAETEVNWDPVDKTVLANEQVVEGRGWRSGAPVERRKIPQWCLKITDYAEELLAGLSALEGNWPAQVIAMQKNWIGRSEGLRFHFSLKGRGEKLEVFTTRADTLFGASFVALAPGHPLAAELAQKNPALARLRESAQKVPLGEAQTATLEKEGADTGLKAIHPLTGAEIPVWAANFVLMEYGTGAIMSVPAHDTRDFEFAEKYGLPVLPVIAPAPGEKAEGGGAFTGDGVMVNSGEYDGMTSARGREAIAAALEKKGAGRREVRYRLRDWGISRQRYWGAPIPVVYCADCGTVPVPEKQLPVTLPPVKEGEAVRPLAERGDFIATDCPQCGAAARRETDTFDTFVESSWYYARFACPGHDGAMLDEKARRWLPVDQYVGGVEHAVLHLLYARFFHRLLRDEGLVDGDEPFTRLLAQGMVLKEGKKMSKSLGNTVDPDALIKKYGADTVRFYVLFAAPPEQSMEWSDRAVEGGHRFIRRLWRLAHEHAECGKKPVLARPKGGAERALKRKIHQTLERVRRDYDKRHAFNTAIAAVMELCNELSAFSGRGAEADALRGEALRAIVLLMNPVTPHVCHALWGVLTGKSDIHDTRLPEADAGALRQNEVKIVVQVNSKVRGTVTLPAGSDEQSAARAALGMENVRRFTEGREIKRTVFIKDRLINIVVAQTP